MAIYKHAQELKQAEHLQNPDQVGCCLVCRFWEAEQRRTEAIVRSISRCTQPELREAELLVSGSSGCNRWQHATDVAEDAEAYMRGDEKIREYAGR